MSFNSLVSHQGDDSASDQLSLWRRFLAAEDRLHENRNYIRAALLAVKVYLYLQAHPYKGADDADNVSLSSCLWDQVYVEMRDFTSCCCWIGPGHGRHERS